MMRILLIYKETLLPDIWFVRQKSLFILKMYSCLIRKRL